MRWPVLLILVALSSTALAEEPPAPVVVKRSLEQTLRLAGEAVMKGDWRRIEALGPTAADVGRLETAFAASKSKDAAKQLAGMRAFIKKHGGYEGAAAQQRRDIVARTKEGVAQLPSDSSAGTMRWSRYLPVRRTPLRSQPFALWEECFALADTTREFVFAAPMLDGVHGWTYMAGIEFRETIPAKRRIEEPNTKTHPFAGLWTGIEAGPLQRDVTLWLQPMEEAAKYIGRFLLSQDTPKGTSVSAVRISGALHAQSERGPALRWKDGFAVLVEKDLLQGRLDQKTIALRRIHLDKPPPHVDRSASLTLKGIAAVSTPELSQVRRSVFDLTMKSAPKQPIQVKVRPRKGADPEVDAWIRADLEASHTGGSIVSGSAKPPYFALIKHKHAVLFRLVWHKGRFGPMPAIVHAYAPLK